ncbi:molybdopterin molybdotransferase MoeA [soil metagenome]
MVTTVDEHAAHVARLLAPALAPGAETVALDDALGRVTTAAVASPVDLPLFRNSQMDGFAVRSADLSTIPAQLLVVGDIPAMALNPRPIEHGMAARIMTGAVMPEGADAVVPVEDTTTDGGTVVIARARTVGEYVREKGSDLHAGDQLLPAGLRLGSRHLAALAAAGITAIEVRAVVRVAVITTGTEIVQPGITPVLGQVFDSNATALAAAVRSCGATVSYRAHVGDDTALMGRALADAAAHADLILTSGGISMGDYEVVRQTLEPLGAAVTSIAMQPGGPQATAVFEGVPVVCFPGNPVSTQLSFEIFVAPLLREVAGLPPAVRAPRTLATAARSVAGRRQFLRGRALPGGRVELVSGASSHLVAGLAASDLLIDVPADVTSLEAGATVETWEL